MIRPQTFVEHDILSLDASRGIRYASFEDFWTRRMEPMQFIPADASGALRACREVLKQRAKEQWEIFDMKRRQGLLVLQPMPPAVEISSG